MRVTLIHNAGAGKAGPESPALVQQVLRAGHAVTYVRCRADAIADALQRSTDLIAIAGGDGTVARIASMVHSGGPPLTILPLGTANNIATALGLARPMDELIGGWDTGETRPFYRLLGHGPWGCRPLMEGVGFGAIEHAIATLGSKKPGVKGARKHIARSVCDAEAETLTISLDGVEFSGRFAALELTTIPLLGPKLCLAPKADPTARAFELCIVPDTPEQRDVFSRWIADGADGSAVPATFRRGEHAVISGDFRRLRLNDKLWPTTRDKRTGPIGTVRVEAEADPIHFRIPQ